MAKSGFVVALEPLLELGPNHPATQALVAALEAEWKERASDAIGNGHSAEERAWFCGAAQEARDLWADVMIQLEERKAM